MALFSTFPYPMGKFTLNNKTRACALYLKVKFNCYEKELNRFPSGRESSAY